MENEGLGSLHILWCELRLANREKHTDCLLLYELGVEG